MVSEHDLFSYPQSAGYKARDTAREAAELTPAALLRERVYGCIKSSMGLTADEAAMRLGLSILSVRPRCTELSRLGKIRDSGHRRKNHSGRRAVVWSAL